MGITDTLARDDGSLDINTGTTAVPIWTPIAALNNWAVKPEKSSAPTPKFSNQGWKSHLPSGRGLTHTWQGLWQRDIVTGAKDPGQAACEALSLVMGLAGVTEFRHSLAGGIVNIFRASCTVTPGGGNDEDPNSWELELEMTGPPTTTTTAAVPSVVTSPTGTGGSGTISASWTDGATVGTLFEVTVFNGTTLVRTAYSSEKPVLISGLTAGSRTIKVRAQNAAGWGVLSAASSSITVS